MEQNRLDRAISVAAGAGTDAVLLAHPSAVTWLTGYAAKIETGPSPFALSALAALACPYSPIWSRNLGRPASGDRRARLIEPGDLVLCDLVPRVGGYGATRVRPSPWATRALPATRTPGRERRSRPWSRRSGVAAAELDALARARLTFPHHAGHGLGTGWHEESRIVPGAATVLEEDVVVALEAGSYAGIGVRLEQVVVVTSEGCEDVSGHDLAL